MPAQPARQRHYRGATSLQRDDRSDGDTEKGTQAFELFVERPAKVPASGWARRHIADLRLQGSEPYRQIGPANHAVPPEKRQRIVAPLAVADGGIRLEAI